MDFFNDKKLTKQVEYLEDERKKLWNRISELENKTKLLDKDIQRKTSDFEKDAAQSSRKASEYKNKIDEKLAEAIKLVSTINDKVSKVDTEAIHIENKKLEIDEIITRADQTEDELISSAKKLEQRVLQFDQFLLKYPDLEAEIVDIDANLSKIEDNVSKSTVTINALNKRKQEIDAFYREIFGYNDTDATTGEVTKIEGTKDELDKVYQELSEQGLLIKENVEEIDNNYKKKFIDFEKEHKDKYSSITSEIEALLPNALTAGLSAAFSKKKEDEENSAKKLQTRFSLGIYLLIIVSLIPFLVSAAYIYKDINLEEAINRLPRLVLAIIPIYIPILWFTYSANKKLNLSKRLIEEYAHKEVLSKTYEGLSKQIKGLTDPVQSDELKFRLLTNFLQVSSENPGKLISNYETSDHPVMEALEQSYKFQIAIDRLEAIPGLGKVAAILESKAKKKLAMKKEVIDRVLPNDDQEESEEEEEV
ncbi:hypothetical protein ABDJ41_08105 [Pedobacter sp. ASV1-7]|uniref:hypothetical protein n=1 Tax=Pedobacter sp. ASV1-7 TaxID=3145237 RepID=UPI0032E92A23